MARYSVSWKLKCKGHSDLTGTYSGISASSDNEAREEAIKRLKQYHSQAFKDGYEIAEMKIKRT